jgi:V/A-type H+/Na+-transporting ATPase subunit E
MTQEAQVQELEAALLSRARSLADEHLRSAKAARERIVAQYNEKLRLREEKEVLAAKQLAEKQYKRKVQAAEIRMQSELDRLRWNLVQAVMEQVKQQFIAMTRNESAYLAWLKVHLAESGAGLPSGNLVVCLNATDQKRLAPHWDALCAAALPGRQVAMAGDSCAAAGGFIIETENRRMRLDETLEGRMERLQAELHRAIMEHLFASVPDMGALFRG